MAGAQELIAEAHHAWKSGDGERARALTERAIHAGDERESRAGLARLRGLVELYGGDQAAAQENLELAAEALSETEPGQAAGLLFMAADAASHRGRVDEAVEYVRRVRAPGYRRFGEWFAASLCGELAAGPWQVLDGAPPELDERNAHRWVLSMAISRHGPYPGAARAFGVVAVERLDAYGIGAMGTVVLTWLAELELRLGHLVDAHAHAGEALTRATAMSLSATATDAHALLAHLAAITGADRQCRHHAEFALRTAAVTHNDLAAARANWALGCLHLAHGEFSEAAERLRRLPHPAIAAAAVADRVEALVRCGEAGEARAVLGEFTGDPAALASCRAQLPAEEPETQFTLALSTPDSELRTFDRARTRLRYGRWLRRERRVAEAVTQLRAALEAFQGLGAAPWTGAAAAELRAAGARAGDTTAHPLTAQEREVARLAASGLSNKEIGARLFISPRTVGYHLYKIFPKLGIANRAQLRGTALAG
ncbi:LuxR C-terminal-related transcriptional regulator [Amycolatopsis minnesotensis]|uniref:HTH luxR-type domain-containing protein n=1 Tax=Amycolatopsis minnesotensis TaxID=337894 RepID=A0ABP5BVM0_9PSEU